MRLQALGSRGSQRDVGLPPGFADDTQPRVADDTQRSVGFAERIRNPYDD